MTDNDLLYELTGDAGPQSLRRSYYELGRSLIQLREWDEASRYLFYALQVVDVTVEEWKIYVLLAFAYRQTGQSGLSDQYLLQSIATAPPNIAAKLSESVSVETGPKVGGEPEAMGLDPLLIMMGEAEMDRRHKDYNSAKEKMGQALQLLLDRNIKDRQMPARHSLANILYESGEFDGAREQALILQQDPALAAAAMLLQGKCLLAEQQYEQPLKFAEELIKKDSSLQAHILKLQSYLYASDYKEALEAVHNAFIVYPSNDELQFYKMQILIESGFNSEEGLAILNQLKTTEGIDFIIDKLSEPYLRFRSHHGNDNFFVAQLYNWLPEKYSPIQALEEADKAINEKISLRDTEYPHGIAYRLKAQIYERINDMQNAAEFYCLAGKEFYWSRQYPVASTLFEKALKLNDNHIEAYRYYADNQLLLSFKAEFPYVDKDYLNQSLEIWNEGYRHQLPSVQDAWTYLTLARIHEQRCLDGNADRTIISQSAWLAVEKNLLLAGQGYFALTFFSRIHRDVDGMEQSSYLAAKKAEELNNDNVQVWEAIAAISLNLGFWEEGLAALKKLRTAYPGDIVYAGWEAFAVVGIRDYEKGIELSSEALEKDPSWSWARQLRLVCNWFLDRTDAMKPDVDYLLSKEKDYLANKSYWDIAFAYFVSGNPEKAIAVCDSAPQTKEFEKYKYMYKCMYKAAMQRMEAAEKDLDQYLELCRVERDVIEQKITLQKIGNGVQLFSDKFEARQNEVRHRWAALTPAIELEALERSRGEYTDAATDGWLAWHLSHFRMMLEEKNWKKAVHEAELVTKTRTDYPDARLMYDRLLQAMQAWLVSLLKNGEPFDQWTLLRASLDYISQPFISLPDTWYISSLLASNRGESVIADEFATKARSQYSNLNEDDMEKNIRRLKDQFPEIDNYLSKEDSATVSGSSVCKKCGSKITSPDQRFCYHCGDSLYSGSSMAAMK